MIQGSCHCGQVHWRLEGEPGVQRTTCNCTICRRYGVLWAFDYEGQAITVSAPTRAYLTGDKSLGFHFCANCGCVAYRRALAPGTDGRRRIAVNLRLAEPEAVAALAVEHFDGLATFDDLGQDGVACGICGSRSGRCPDLCLLGPSPSRLLRGLIEGAMAITLTALTDIFQLGFDDIIDVRAPLEFADDHIPGGFPAGAGRCRTGRGGYHLQAGQPVQGAQGRRGAGRQERRPCICRGRWPTRPGRGSRWSIAGVEGSGRALRLDPAPDRLAGRHIAGGYESWRGLVVQALYDTPVAAPVVVLDGNTGSAKRFCSCCRRLGCR